MQRTDLKIVYFGGEPLGVPVLEELEACGFSPSLIVCNPDRPVGRKQVVTPPPVKTWALEHNIEVFQPESFTDKDAILQSIGVDWDLFVVVAYNQIFPEWLIDVPKFGTINLHPSLLPKLRGTNPIRETILRDMREECGVSIMLLDEKMDHGPILAQQKMKIAEENWPIAGRELDLALAQLGGAVLADTISKWIDGGITPVEQNHTEATYTKKMQKSDGELQIDPYNLPTDDEAYRTLLKIRAYDGFPGTFFMHDGKRNKVTDAELAEDGSLRVLTIIPEGKKEMKFSDYFKN